MGNFVNALQILSYTAFCIVFATILHYIIDFINMRIANAKLLLCCLGIPIDIRQKIYDFYHHFLGKKFLLKLTFSLKDENCLH